MLAAPSTLNKLAGATVDAFLGLVGQLLLKLYRVKHRHIRLTEGNPLVTVLIPTHNRAGLLISRSLPSVLSQTYENLEVIICAHGCTDETLAQVGEIPDKRLRVLEVPRENLGYPETLENHWLVGPVRPLNAGTKLARGDYLAIIGDDDEWVPDHIESSVRELQRTRSEWVSSWSREINATGEETLIRGSDEGGAVIGPVATWVYAAHLRFAKWNIHSWRKSWNRPNDIDMARRLLKIGVRHATLPRVGAIWQPRPGETSLGVAAYLTNPEKMLDHFSIKKELSENQDS